MVTLKVINIQKQPWWKFWKTDQWSVTVEVDGKRRILSIYESPTNYLSKNCLIDFIRYKYLHNDQFWDIHQKPKKSQKLPSLTEFQKRLEETLKGTEITV